MIHSKLISVDAKYALVGSANLTKESLHFHEETALLFVKNDIQKRLHTSAEDTLTQNLFAELLPQPREENE